ncbi:hypothetical protein EW146_g8470 [Bondarzewia mesenterica]|uniref:Uncharacterized protein n=1 Tax=Bondarzewia mesenterica TaxID=1095465 RepID=A0A4S4LE61_9AGAM|nr:hypothetical protein EW146_g8470 [Bondarzewia mesenterica]
MPQRNQHNPCPPENLLRPILTYYYNLRKSDKDIAELVAGHFDLDLYGLSPSSVKRYRNKWGLLGTRKQSHSLESIGPYVQKIRKRFPARGARKITDALWVQYRMRALRTEVHSGYINWVKIWRTNRNPRLITKYYIDAARKIRGVPLVTQSDLGSENYGIVNAHTTVRRRLDPSLTETLQHRWMRKSKNVKPEILWSILRHDFSPGFEDILQMGFDNGWYDPDNELESLVFLWLAVPWLQAELDTWVHQQNQTARRANRNKILPHGIPDLIMRRPQLFQSLDFKIIVSNEVLNEIEQEYAPPDNPVFDLVPRAFEDRARQLYTALGELDVTSESFWTVYRSLLEEFRNMPYDPEIAEAVQLAATYTNNNDNDHIPLLPLANLRQGGMVVAIDQQSTYEYVGGVEEPVLPKALASYVSVSGDGDRSESEEEMGQPEYADLTSDSDEDSGSEL